MSATVGVNSYVTVEEATTYYAARYGFDAWAASTFKDAALVSAAQVLDNYATWFGDKTDYAQPLQFPRVGIDHADVPEEVKDAQCEIAYLIITNQSTSQVADDPLTSLKAGSLALSFNAVKKRNPLISPLVESLLMEFGLSSGGGATKIIPVYRC